MYGELKSEFAALLQILYQSKYDVVYSYGTRKMRYFQIETLMSRSNQKWILLLVDVEVSEYLRKEKFTTQETQEQGLSV